MKYFLIATILLLCQNDFCFAQGCPYGKIQSPIVAKPTDGHILSATCSTLVVGWQGAAAGQSYTVFATYYNTVTKKIDTLPGGGISCNGALVCSANIPVNSNTKISWFIQAVSTINSRTFYSYLFRGEQDYAIPSCRNSIVKAGEAKNTPENSLKDNKLNVFPNPVTGLLTVRWTGNYRGDATIVIADVTGKQIKKVSFTKSQALFSQQLQVNSLQAGIYYLYARTNDGRQLATRFVKD